MNEYGGLVEKYWREKLRTERKTYSVITMSTTDLRGPAWFEPNPLCWKTDN